MLGKRSSSIAKYCFCPIVKKYQCIFVCLGIFFHMYLSRFSAIWGLFFFIWAIFHISFWITFKFFFGLYPPSASNITKYASNAVLLHAVHRYYKFIPTHLKTSRGSFENKNTDGFYFFTRDHRKRTRPHARVQHI